MTLLRKLLVCFVLTAPCAGAFAAAEADGPIKAPFSDPTRPGTVHVGLISGSITVVASDTREVLIEVSGEALPQPPPEDARGLRRLTPQPGVTVEERNNRMELKAWPPHREIELRIQVPKQTQLELSTVNNGDIRVERVEGELEIGNVNGNIELTDVSGAVVAHTVNGRVLATLTRVATDKPMAFTSLNGAVDVTLPSTIKANLKLRTDNGSAFTDFDLNVQPTSSTVTPDSDPRGRGRYRIEVNKVISGSVNGGGPEIEMRTFNGNIYLRKGGGPTPSTGTGKTR
jgi:hypothetical protein